MFSLKRGSVLSMLIPNHSHVDVRFQLYHLQILLRRMFFVNSQISLEHRCNVNLDLICLICFRVKVSQVIFYDKHHPSHDRFLSALIQVELTYNAQLARLDFLFVKENVFYDYHSKSLSHQLLLIKHIVQFVFRLLT